MTRQLKGLSLKLAHDLCAEIPRLGIIEECINDPLCNIILDDPVIMKVYDDHIVIDLGGKKAFLSENDFVSIEVR